MSAETGTFNPDQNSSSDGHQEEDGVYAALSHSPLNVLELMDRVKHPDAGAVVTFSGTTRRTTDSRRVSKLSYSSYTPLALRSMLSVGSAALKAHSLFGVAVAHRLGPVPVGETSVVVAVSSAHRTAAWRAGEEVLEEVKKRVEIWKMEVFEDEGPEGNKLWRANRDPTEGWEAS